MQPAEQLLPTAVTVTNRETGLKRVAATDAEGRFNFPQLPPGTYSVEVEAQGFEEATDGQRGFQSWARSRR